MILLVNVNKWGFGVFDFGRLNPNGISFPATARQVQIPTGFRPPARADMWSPVGAPLGFCVISGRFDRQIQVAFSMTVRLIPWMRRSFVWLSLVCWFVAVLAADASTG